MDRTCKHDGGAPFEESPGKAEQQGVCGTVSVALIFKMGKGIDLENTEVRLVPIPGNVLEVMSTRR